MTKLFLGKKFRELALPAPFVALRSFLRRFSAPWTMAKHDTLLWLQRAALLAVTLAAMTAPAAAETHTYDVLTVNVPFKFNIGNRSFSPGHYQFIFVGPGMLAMRDDRQQTIASLVTKSVDADAPLPTTKLVFNREKTHQQLAEIWLENRSQVIKVVGEEVPVYRPWVFSSAPLTGDALFSIGQQEVPAFRR